MRYCIISHSLLLVTNRADSKAPLHQRQLNMKALQQIHPAQLDLDSRVLWRHENRQRWPMAGCWLLQQLTEGRWRAGHGLPAAASTTGLCGHDVCDSQAHSMHMPAPKHLHRQHITSANGVFSFGIEYWAILKSNQIAFAVLKNHHYYVLVK